MICEDLPFLTCVVSRETCVHRQLPERKESVKSMAQNDSTAGDFLP